MRHAENSPPPTPNPYGIGLSCQILTLALDLAPLVLSAIANLACGLLPIVAAEPQTPWQ
jgi:hypothetical protein